MDSEAIFLFKGKNEPKFWVLKVSEIFNIRGEKKFLTCIWPNKLRKKVYKWEQNYWKVFNIIWCFLKVHTVDRMTFSSQTVDVVEWYC